VLILRQGLSFGLVGGLQLLLDWAVFVLTSWVGLPVQAANLVGRIAGASLGFRLNGVLTFRGEGGSTATPSALNRFVVSWTLLTAVSTLAISVIEHQSSLAIAWLAKPAVESVLAGINFFISRHWVYRDDVPKGQD
jgi:putative flippase GtrA